MQAERDRSAGLSLPWGLSSAGRIKGLGIWGKKVAVIIKRRNGKGRAEMENKQF